MTGKKQCFNIKDMKVPFNDLQRHHLDIKDEIDAAIDRVINCSGFIEERMLIDLKKNSLICLMLSILFRARWNRCNNNSS